MSTLAVPIVVLDDHRMVVLGLRTLFHSRPEVEVVAWAHDADSALAATREHRPRVAVLDIALEGSDVDGIDLTQRLHEELPEKADPSTDLLKAVLLASRGKRYTSPAFAVRAEGNDFDELSPKQLTALRLLAQGMERREIAERMGIGEETVKTHLAEVRRKLGARTSAQAVAIGLINSMFDYPADE